MTMPSISRLIVLLSVLSSWLVGGPFADACKCRPPDIPSQFEEKTDVMRVKILSGSTTKNMKPGEFGSLRVYAALVITSYKGNTSKGDFVILTSRTQSAACGTQLFVKQQMLVTASSYGQSPGNFMVDSCGYNKKWKAVKGNRTDMQFLNSLGSSDYEYYKTCGDPVCRYPPPETGLPACPKGVEVGTKCPESDKGKECDPGEGCNVRLRCTDSDPTYGGACPISRRATKRDIKYLDSSSRASFASDLLKIPLAEWNYKQDPVEIDPRLGFIIEDIEPSPAVDSERDMVNMYGFLSMAVAAIQTQQEEIIALQEAVEELQKDVENRQATFAQIEE